MSMIGMVYAVTPSDMQRLAADPGDVEELLRYDNPKAVSVSVEKAWHGLHYLLTGSAEESGGPLGFLLEGGAPIEEADGGYGPPRLFTPEETRAIQTALAGISDVDLWSRFNRGDMTKQGIYPEIWDEPEADLRDEYLMYFRELKSFLDKAVAAGKGMMVVLC
jgi:hypothetical protein